MVREDFNVIWDKTLQTVKTGDKKLWNLTKNMMNKGTNKVEMLKINGNVVTADEKIAEALADQFLENHSLTVNFRHSIDKQVKNSVDSINRTEPCITQTSSHHVNLDEIKKIIYKLKIKKSPGLDGIANILLKRLPETAVIYLTTIINKCVDLCYFPKQFKMAKVISTLKPTKDPKNSSSYRPISLLSSVGQIYETI